MNVNWLVVGIGDITRKAVIPAIEAEPRSVLYGVVTRELAKAAAYRDLHPDLKAWETLEEALKDEAIDAVYVGSPVFCMRRRRLRRCVQASMCCARSRWR